MAKRRGGGRTAGGGLVVVTGAGSGIGRATAERFARSGRQVIACDIDAAAAGETAAGIGRSGGRAEAAGLDVSDAEAYASFAARVREEHGVPDVVVSAAGRFVSGRFLDHTPEDWESLFSVNVLGVVNGCRLFGAQMVERGSGGQLVNVSSLGAFLPLRFAPAYGASKSAVRILSESLRIELAQHGIGVSVVCPSGIRSNLSRNGSVAGVDPERQDELRAQTNDFQNRIALAGPDKVARAIERAVAHDWAFVPVNPDAWAMYAMSRLSPRLLRKGASVATFEAWLGGARRLAARRRPWRRRSG